MDSSDKRFDPSIRITSTDRPHHPPSLHTSPPVPSRSFILGLAFLHATHSLHLPRAALGQSSRITVDQSILLPPCPCPTPALISVDCADRLGSTPQYCAPPPHPLFPSVDAWRILTLLLHPSHPAVRGGYPESHTVNARSSTQQLVIADDRIPSCGTVLGFCTIGMGRWTMRRRRLRARLIWILVRFPFSPFTSWSCLAVEVPFRPRFGCGFSHI